MKNLLYILAIATLLTACEKTPKDYVTLSGVIKNQNSDSLIIAKRGIIKTIKVNSDGSFSDTLKVDPGSYILFDGAERAEVYLKNGYDLKISLDTKEFDETLSFQGLGAETNNYLAQKTLIHEKIDYASLLEMNKADFDKTIKANNDELLELLMATKNIDSSFIASQEKEIEMTVKQFNMMYNEKLSIAAFKGKESPKFENYENYNGGTTSLEDLKGKYVYIDLWATWCGPCKAEIPSLKRIEKAYHGKNIEFVSISVDRNSAHEKWKAMVKEKELTGIQLFAKEDKTFAEAYKVSGIPRFILIDPSGIIVDADAPRPSNPKLIELLNTLAI